MVGGLPPGAVLRLLRELRGASEDPRPLGVAGAPALAAALRRGLAEGAAPGAVREGFDRGAAALVYVLAAERTGDDDRVLREAEKRRVPVVVVLAGPGLDPRVPYVPATDVVAVDAGSGFPLEQIADVLARRLGEQATGLAARVPAVRGAVCRHLVSRFSRRNGVLGAAIFIPGADFPVLTLNQLRLALRIAAAHGVEIDRERVPEVLAVIGGGLVLRTVARQAVGVVPVAGWAVKGGVAYAGTRAVGEAAIRYFEARSA
jgi:uncharacterized protein (DUF697 family)